MCPNKSPRAAIRVSGQPGRRPSPLDGYARRLDCDSGMRRLTHRPVDRQAIASRSPRGGRRPCGCASRSAPRDGAGLRPSQECTHPLPATGWGCGSNPPALSRQANACIRRKAESGQVPQRRPIRRPRARGVAGRSADATAFGVDVADLIRRTMVLLRAGAFRPQAACVAPAGRHAEHAALHPHRPDTAMPIRRRQAIVSNRRE